MFRVSQVVLASYLTVIGGMCSAEIVYFGASSGTYALDTADGSIGAVAETPIVDPFGVTIVENSLVWTDFATGTINSADLGGGPASTIYDRTRLPQMAPYSIVAGSGNRSLFWSDTHLDGIFEGSLDGSVEPQRLNLGNVPSGEIKGLAFDGSEGLLYYHDQASSASLFQFDLSTQVVTELTDAANRYSQARGLAGDFSRKRLFLGESDRIVEFDLATGLSREVFRDPFQAVRDVAFSNATGLVYYSSVSNRSIYQVNPDTLNVRVFDTGSLAPQGLAVVAVPEPDTFPILIASLLLVVVQHRRKRLPLATIDNWQSVSFASEVSVTPMRFSR